MKSSVNCNTIKWKKSAPYWWNIISNKRKYAKKPIKSKQFLALIQ